MSADPWNDPATRAWARDFEDRVVPAMRASSVVAPVWSGGVSAQMADEVGASVLLDKPLIVVVQTGTPVPDKLVRIADRIVEADVRTRTGRESLAGRLQRAMDDLKRERGGDG